MEVETTEGDGGTEITVRSEESFAVSVRDGETEEIYLPDVSGSDSSYYVEEGSGESAGDVYSFWHEGSADDVQVIS